MKFTEVTEQRTRYRSLLLLADEQESLVNDYIEKGKMFVLADDGIKAVCVVVPKTKEVLEIKNIAVIPSARRQGYGKMLIEFLSERFRRDFSFLEAGTGDSPLTRPFYESCGFSYFSTVKNYFPEHYDHPIVEEGVLLTDKIIFRKRISFRNGAREEKRSDNV